MFVTGGCNNVTSGVGAGDVGCVCQGCSQRNSPEVRGHFISTPSNIVAQALNILEFCQRSWKRQEYEPNFDAVFPSYLYL